MDLLLLSSITLGLLHALAPDHWLPFVMMGRAQKWSRVRLTFFTSLAGLGHVTSSLVIAGVGVLLGVAAEQVELFESNRGNVASLLLIGFGIAYLVWGIKNWGRKHSHGADKVKALSSWTLSAVIVFGPCEPLIPLVFVGYGIGWAAVVAVFVAFSLSTILMMLLQVHLASYGISFLKSHWLEHGSEVMAGGVIVLLGVAMRIF